MVGRMKVARPLVLAVGAPFLAMCTPPVPAPPAPERSMDAAALELVSAAESAIGASAFADVPSMELRATGEALYVGQGVSPQQSTRVRAAGWHVIMDRTNGRFERRDRQFADGGVAWCSARGGDETGTYRYDCISRDLEVSSQRIGADEIVAWESSLPFGWLRLARRQAESLRVMSDPGEPPVLEVGLGSRRFVLELDAGNLLRRVRWEATGELGQEVTRAAEFSDYRPVGKFLFPYSIAYLNPGGHGDSLQVEYIRLQPELHDSIGRPPAGAFRSPSPRPTPPSSSSSREDSRWCGSWPRDTTRRSWTLTTVS